MFQDLFPMHHEVATFPADPNKGATFQNKNHSYVPCKQREAAIKEKAQK